MMQEDRTAARWFFLGLSPLLVFWLGLSASILIHAQPAIYDTQPLTFEQNDFPPAAVAGPASFTTTAAPKNRIVFVFRNGLFQRLCPAAGAPACDYTKAGTSLITIAYPQIQVGDQITILYFR